MDTSYQAPAVPRCWELIGYLTLAILIFLGILLQGFLIGALLFAGAGWAADAHAIGGLVMLTLALLLPLAGWLARLPGRLTILSAVLSALTLIQVILPNLSDSLPFVAALHPPQRHAALWADAAAHAGLARDEAARGRGRARKGKQCSSRAQPGDWGSSQRAATVDGR